MNVEVLKYEGFATIVDADYCFIRNQNFLDIIEANMNTFFVHSYRLLLGRNFVRHSERNLLIIRRAFPTLKKS